MDLPGNADDMVIVKATIDLAHNMGLSVTAEGVETLDSRELLRSYHCDVIQGYLISKPMCERDMSRWMSGHRNRLGRGAGVGAEPDSVCGLIDVLLPT
jgi:EAL domain-containing protein (putative c-di-GMP-specific phosphodiesterase class I)